MKNKILGLSLLLAITLGSCAPAGTLVPPPPKPISTYAPIPTLISPTAQPQTVDTQSGPSIESYQDVRFENLSQSNIGESLIETLWFDESTQWSSQDKKIAQNILKLGMNPGLGIRDLHSKGITGKGVRVAIIDQNMVLDHPEFKGKIVNYYDAGTNTSSFQGSMHGPAVTSLLVGQNIGTAPDALVYYVAVPSWLQDAKYYADALNWIIDENEKLPIGDKIRVVSVSAAPSGVGSPFTKNNEAWDIAYKRAADAGILVLDCTYEHGITAPCYYYLKDPDNIKKCIPGWPGVTDYRPATNRIYIPVSLRTTAEEYTNGSFTYQYTGQGGLSWSVPYLAGVLAMGWQINPTLTSSQLLDILFNSAYISDTSAKIINPLAFIERVKLTINK